MAKFAIISGIKVDNIIVADSSEEAQVFGTVVEVTDSNPAGIGWTYDENTGKFISPVKDVTEESNA